MPRRESGLEFLIRLPWYIPLAIGAVLFLGAPTVAGLIVSASPILAKSHQALAGLSKLVSYICFGAAAISLLRSYFVRQKFAAQRSLADLRELTWQQFETIVGEAFRRTGYSVVETGQGGADGGVDLVLMKAGQRYLAQCKQYRASTVGVTTVREIYGVVAARRAAGALVVTTGSFTKDAIAFAANQPIELIDGVKLEAMVRGINRMASPPSAESSSAPPATPAAVMVSSCPKCGSAMVPRTARAQGTRFFGCSRYPKCRGTRPD